MALAKTTDPSGPKRGMRRVLLLPGMGHFATTTILPRATFEHEGRGVFVLWLVVPLVSEKEVVLVVVTVGAAMVNGDE
jgi:hypothetical protein